MTRARQDISKFRLPAHIASAMLLIVASTPATWATQPTPNDNIPRGAYSKPKEDCKSNPNLPGCYRPPVHINNPPVIYIQQPGTAGTSATTTQREVSYRYVADQQKACTQPNPDGFAGGDLNKYCVAKFKDTILQHCANFNPDSHTSAICEMALDLDYQQKK